MVLGEAVLAYKDEHGILESTKGLSRMMYNEVVVSVTFIVLCQIYDGQQVVHNPVQSPTSTELHVRALVRNRHDEQARAAEG